MTEISSSRGPRILTEDEEATLEGYGQTQVRPKGTIFMVEGEDTDFVMLIRKGSVQVKVGQPPRIVGFRHAGEIVGEMAPIRKKPRSATIEAVTEVVAVLISAANWRQFLREHPDAALALLALVDERLDEATQKIIESDFQVERRVAMALIDLAENQADVLPDTTTVELRVSQADLAALSGVKLPSVKASLGTFRQNGLISTGRERLVIREFKRLRDIADGVLL